MPFNLIWIGQVDGERHKHYFENQELPEGEDDDGMPYNEFARDQGETVFDFDFVEISYLTESEDVRSFVDGHSYFETYLDQVVARAKRLGMEKINVFILAGDDQFSNPQSVKRDGIRLEYLGKFEYEDEDEDILLEDE